MTQQTINVGANANDRKGDSLRTAFQKVNANFTELFNSSGFTGTTDRLVNGNKSAVLSNTGILTLPFSNYLETTDVNLKVGSQGFVTIRSNAASNLTDYEWTFDEVGILNLPECGAVGAAVIQPNDTTFGIKLISNGNTWAYGTDGALTLPEDGNVRQRNSFTRTSIVLAPTATETVVWTANQDWTSAIKLTIQVEGRVTGDNTGWHVQTCEATIASRGYANGTYGYGDPEMSVYGIIYTSTSPLATFGVQRNPTTRFVEVLATGTDLNNNITVSIHSLEIGTAD